MKLTFVSFEDDGEAEGFIDEQGRVIAGWSCNDASWRSEYMDSLLHHLGVKVEYPRKKSAAHIAALRKYLDWPEADEENEDD